MSDLVFAPVADKIEDSTYVIYDGACGTGGMLTVAIVDEFNGEFSGPEWKEIRAHICRLAEMISEDRDRRSVAPGGKRSSIRQHRIIRLVSEQ